MKEDFRHKHFLSRAAALGIAALCALCAVVAPSASCKRNTLESSSKPAFCLPPDSVLHEGDLVLRRGHGPRSAAVAGLDTAKKAYSHIGLLVKESGKWLVAHAAPPEEKGGPDTLRLETIEQFFSPDVAAAGAIMAVDCRHGEAMAAARYAKLKVKSHTRFDTAYDWADSSRLYCTELVARAYRSAGVDLTQGRHTRIDTKLIANDVVLPGDITASQLVTVKFTF